MHQSINRLSPVPAVLACCLLNVSAAKASVELHASFNPGSDASYTVDYDDGFDTGYTVGYDSGFNAGKLRGFDQGSRQGREQGYSAGWSDAYAPAYEFAYTLQYPVGLRQGYADGLFSGFDAGYYWAESVATYYAQSSSGVTLTTGDWNPGSGSVTTYSSAGTLEITGSSFSMISFDSSLSIVDPAVHHYNQGFKAGKSSGFASAIQPATTSRSLPPSQRHTRRGSISAPSQAPSRAKRKAPPTVSTMAGGTDSTKANSSASMPALSTSSMERFKSQRDPPAAPCEAPFRSHPPSR
jgi:hypothetical protein